MNRKNNKRGLMPYGLLLIFIIGCLIVFNMFNT